MISPRLLIVKTSSLGDVVHTLPAVSDVRQQMPEMAIEWLVEEAYAEIPAWHVGVDRVIPVNLRKWRRYPVKAILCQEVDQFLRAIRQEHYTYIVDAQGLLKSALLACAAHGPRYGPAPTWAREKWASRLYHHLIAPPVAQPAVARVRYLLSTACSYPPLTTPSQFAIEKSRLPAIPKAFAPYWMFLTGTTWPSKQWPEAFWIDLACIAHASGVEQILLPWSNNAERERTERIAKGVAQRYGPIMHICPRLSLGVVAAYIAGACGVVGVDSGLSHLAAALNVPGTTLFGATDADRLGVTTATNRPCRAIYPCAPCHQRQCPLPTVNGIHPPCYHALAPVEVWRFVTEITNVMRLC